MKPFRLFIFLLFALLTVSLSACAGGGSVPASWPGASANGTGETIYVAYNTQVYGVDPASGATKWSYPAEPQASTTFYAPPVQLGDDMIILGSYDHSLRAIRANGGQPQEVWSFTEAANRFVAAPLVDDGQIYAPNADRFLYKLDDTGRELWRYEAKDALWSTPVKQGDTLYVSSMGHRLYALDADTGEELWKTDDLGGAIVSSPTLGENGLLFIGTLDNEVVAIDQNDGTVAWEYKTDAWVWSAPALDNGTLYFGDLNGIFHAVDAQTGERKWVVDTEIGPQYSISDRPVVIGDTVYFTSENGALHALDTAAGTERWTKTVPGKLYGSPIHLNDLLIVSPEQGEGLLVAFDLNGNQQWIFKPAE